MPNWSDDEGRCHFDVNGVPCYQSPTGCQMHEVKQPKRKRHQVSPLKTQAKRHTAHRVWTHCWVESANIAVQNCRCGYWRTVKPTGATGPWQEPQP